MTLTFLNLVVVRGILVGLIQGSVEVYSKYYSGDIFISNLPKKSYIENSQSIISIVKGLPWVDTYTARYVESGSVEANYKTRVRLTDDPNVAGGVVAGINPEMEDKATGISSKIVEGTNVVVTGGVDDVWVSPNGELIIVDYKATSKDTEVSLDAEWQDGYKRQMEIYQWLFRENGFTVSPTGYFVYCNGDTDKEAFDGKLEFDIKLLPYTGDDRWVYGKVHEAISCLNSDIIPDSGENCSYCQYIKAREEVSS
jgi:hypothetical protein